MRGGLLSCALLLTSAAQATSARASNDYSVSLPAARLSQTMFEISRLTGIEIAFADADLARRRGQAVTGRYGLRELLDAATSQTGTSYRFITPRTVLISRRPASPIRTARPPDNEQASLQSIVVTAGKREQYLQDLPMSTSSLSQIAMDRIGLNDVRAIARTTPGVLIRNAWGGSTNLSIRGIYSNSGSATTGVYVDDTPIQTRSLGAGVTSTNSYPALFDLARVEVLRGPQGVLFGSSSEGGTIRFITREPDLHRTSGAAAFETFHIGGGEPGYEASLATGRPVLEDRLGYRLSIFARQDGGWIDRAPYPDGAVVRRNSNRLRTLGARAAVTYRFESGAQLTPSLFYQHASQQDADQFWSLLSNLDKGRFRSGARLAQPSRDSFLLSTVKVTADLPGMAMLSTTSYFRRRRPSTVDYTDYMIEILSRGAQFSLATLPDYRAEVDFENNQDVVTHEIRFSGTRGGTLKWVGGLFLQRARQDAVEHIHEPLLDKALMTLFNQDARSFFGSGILANGVSYVGKDRSTDWQAAMFGQADFAIGPTLEGTVGGRLAWMYYKQTNFQDGPQSGGRLGAVITHGEMPLLPRFGLNWRPREGQLFYVNAAKGTRIGGGNAPVSVNRCGTQLAALGFSQVPERFKSDTIWNYEAGAKLDLPARGSIHIAAFHFRWKDIQQSFSLRCLFRYTGNNSRARGGGLELMLDLAPAHGLKVTLTGGYTRARYVRPTYGGVINPVTGERALVIAAGQALPSPKWRVSGVVSYEFDLGPTLSAYISASGDYASPYIQGPAPGTVEHDAATYISDGIATARLQTGVRTGRWDAAFYVENLLDSRDALQRSHNVRQSINMRYVIVRPRTIGARLTYNFN